MFPPKATRPSHSHDHGFAVGSFVAVALCCRQALYGFHLYHTSIIAALHTLPELLKHAARIDVDGGHQEIGRDLCDQTEIIVASLRKVKCLLKNLKSVHDFTAGLT